MNIVMAFNDAVAEQALVTIYSVAKNNQLAKIKLSILYSSLSDRNVEKCRRIASFYDNLEVSLILVKKNALKQLEVTNKSVSIEAYYRYMACDLVELQEAKRVLYLDADILCLGSLKDLYETDLEGYYLAAAEDKWIALGDDPKYKGFKKGIGFSNEKYINSGMLLFNLEKIRKDSMMKTFWQNMENKNTLIPKKYNIFADQTITNMTFKGYINIVPNKWNCLLSAIPFLSAQDKSGVVLYHFAGAYKPFSYYNSQTKDIMNEYTTHNSDIIDVIGYNNNGQRIFDSLNGLRDALTQKSIVIDNQQKDIDSLVRLRQTVRDKENHVKELVTELGIVREEHDRLLRSRSYRLTQNITGIIPRKHTSNEKEK